jgi:hypothetical protein
MTLPLAIAKQFNKKKGYGTKKSPKKGTGKR